MSFVTILAGAVVVMGGQPSADVAQQHERDGLSFVDVAYEELRDGQDRAAISKIEANDALESDDPAALINLGTAHARIGQGEAAQRLYLAALASRTPYELELADGRWVDSRRAARMALEGLANGEVLALR